MGAIMASSLQQSLLIYIQNIFLHGFNLLQDATFHPVKVTGNLKDQDL